MQNFYFDYKLSENNVYFKRKLVKSYNEQPGYKQHTELNKVEKNSFSVIKKL